MPYRVRLFAGAREAVAADSISVELGGQATAGALRSRIAEAYPQLAALASRSLLARNSQYVADDDAVRPEDELALIPPVSGG
jgi:molybdopterin synthase catalytic subunit